MRLEPDKWETYEKDGVKRYRQGSAFLLPLKLTENGRWCGWILYIDREKIAVWKTQINVAKNRALRESVARDRRVGAPVHESESTVTCSSETGPE
jgi:hypothetical protein